MRRRIRYVQNLTKRPAMLGRDFEKATYSDIEAVILAHGRLKLTDFTKSPFKILSTSD